MPIVETLSSFFISAGPGGIFVIAMIGLAATGYFTLIRWILKGEEEDSDTPYFK